MMESEPGSALTASPGSAVAVDDDAHDLAASHDLVGLAANAFKHDAVFDDLRASNRRVADEHGAPQHRKHGFAVEGRSHRMG